MKKIFSKVCVIILALTMVFAVGACKDNNAEKIPVSTSGEAIAGLTSAMTKQNGITVSLKGNVSLAGEIKSDTAPVSLKNISFDGKFKMAKTQNDTDMDLNLNVGMSGFNFAFQSIKKGDKTYTKAPFGDWVIGSCEPIYIPELPAEAFEGFDIIDIFEFTETSGGYALTLACDYTDTLRKIQSFIGENKDKTVHRFLFPDSTPESDAALAALLEEMFADDVTLGEWIDAINAALNNGFPQEYAVTPNEYAVTLETIVNMLCAEQGITSEDAYEILSMFGLATVPPQKGEAVYSYVLKCFGGENAKVNDILEFLYEFVSGGSDVPGLPETPNEEKVILIQQIRETLIAYLTTDDNMPTLGDIYNNAVAKLDAPLKQILAVVGNVTGIEEMSNILSAENIANMTFGENKFGIRIELNGNLTLKNMTLIVKNDINLGQEKFAGIDINIGLSFSYGSVNVSAPVIA